MSSTHWPLYRGTKELKATPMTKAEYCLLRGWTVPADEDPAEAGYAVEYQDGGKPNVPGFDGYVSWSPADVFDRTYRFSGSHVDRMRIEQAELYDRLARLNRFLDERGDRIDRDDHNLLLAQRDAMKTYHTLLSARISRSAGESIAEQTDGFVRTEPVVSA